GAPLLVERSIAPSGERTWPGPPDAPAARSPAGARLLSTARRSSAAGTGVVDDGARAAHGRCATRDVEGGLFLIAGQARRARRADPGVRALPRTGPPRRHGRPL